MGEAFESIMRGLTEAKAHREGKLKLKTTSIEIAPLLNCNAKMIKELRADLGLSQSIFANALGVSKKTIEAWESGRNIPSGAACRLLEVIEKDKNLLKREKIVVYIVPSSKARASQGQGSKPAKGRRSQKALAQSAG